MANCLWTFETPTTTGFESDVDTLSGVLMKVLGDGSGADANPCPTVPGHTGNGRLLCSANHYNAFSTDKVVELAHTSGNPVNLHFWWRPLLDYPGVLAGSAMLSFDMRGYNAAGTLGLWTIDSTILSNATAGLIDLSVSVQSFFVPVTTFTFTGIPLTLRGWNEIEVDYAGANSIDFLINGAVVGTIGPTDFPMATSARSQLVFAKKFAISGALMGVLDTVSLEVS